MPMYSAKKDSCFECQKNTNPGKCIVCKFQLEDVKVGERVTIHTSLPGVGPWSATGTLDKEYSQGNTHVFLKHSDGASTIVADF